MKSTQVKLFGFLALLASMALIQSSSAAHTGSAVHFDGISPLVAVTILRSFISLKLKQRK